MFLDNFGELIADIMTIPPDISGVASASAILDTSNYTIQAVSFGKNSEGFRYHAHEILSPSTNISFKVKTYSDSNVSAYYTSTLALNVDGYNLLPDYINPLDTRLERRTTITNISSIPNDIGHNMNSVISSSLSSYYHLVGCYAASNGTTFYVGTSSTNISGSPGFSGVLSSLYNRYGVMDSSGFLTVAPSNINQSITVPESEWATNGVYIIGPANFSSVCRVGYGIFIGPGDLGALNLFGGVYHIGLWALDIKEMLRSGLTPPYSFNPLNNIRKYRLVCKKTFSKDLTYHRFGDEEIANNYATFNELFTGEWVEGDIHSVTMYIRWYLNFL